MQESWAAITVVDDGVDVVRVLMLSWRGVSGEGAPAEQGPLASIEPGPT